MAVRIVLHSTENLPQQSIGDRHAACVDPAGLSNVFERGVPCLIPRMSQAFVIFFKTDTDASILTTHRPVNICMRSHRRPSGLPGFAVRPIVPRPWPDRQPTRCLLLLERILILGQDFLQRHDERRRSSTTTASS